MSTLKLAAQNAKLPPYSIEAEQSVIGGLLIDNRALDACADLREEHFYREDHQLLFRYISRMIGNNRPCDFVTLTESLRMVGKLEMVGGMPYVGSLANDTPSAANIAAYAAIVRERAVMRDLIDVGQEISELGYRPEGRPHRELLTIADEMVAKVQLGTVMGQQTTVRTPELMDRVEKKLEALRSMGSQHGVSGLSTGFVDFDKKTTGLHPGDYVLIAGRPSMGKTSFALNIAEHVALYERKQVAVFSMEMPADQLGLRLLSSFARVNLQKLRSGDDMLDNEWDRITSQGSVIRGAPLVINEQGALSPQELRAFARRYARSGDLSLIVVDYVQLMQVPGAKVDNRTNEMAEISRGLKSLAKELNCPVIALSQLNRGVEARTNKRPMMADLRESGGLEQDADLIAFIYRDEVYNKDSRDKGVAEIIIGKQRNGPLGTIRTAWLPQYTRFDNLQSGDGYDYDSRPSEPAAAPKKKRFKPPAAEAAPSYNEPPEPDHHSED